MNRYYKQIIKKEGNKKELSYKGYDALILRVRPDSSGHLCGYVKISNNSLGFHYDDFNRMGIEVHGGLTFSGELKGEEGYWIGFDCAHAGDLMPTAIGTDLWGDMGYVYRDMEYVEKEIKHLIDQITKNRDVQKILEGLQ